MVRAAAARGETDSASLRSKVTTLDAMKARFAAEPGFVLPEDGTRVPDPSGRWAVSAGDLSSLRVIGADGGEERFSYVRADGALCQFADDGSTLWLRWDQGWHVTYLTVDLPRAIELQRFDDRKGTPPAT